jgi:hypothetical protein
MDPREFLAAVAATGLTGRRAAPSTLACQAGVAT